MALINQLVMSKLSLFAFVAGALFIVSASFFYYPKWKNIGAEATLSWDVSGYYAYLPAAFIYHDLKEAEFLDKAIQDYKPTPTRMQGFEHPSGHFVMKYSMGQALQYLPWFLCAHALAEPLGYPADGFSKPYQYAIGWGSLLVAIIGLWFARRNLLEYFSDRVTALVLLLLVVGTNYLNYTAFDGAMTHNWLFTAYSLLIFSTIKFYRQPSARWAAAIGLLVGWMTLTRPTEIVSALIPLLWGVGNWRELRERVHLFRANRAKLWTAFFCGGLMIFLQLAYWKYVAGEWIVYSYEDQGFDWLRPHLISVLFSYKAGWLTYSPLLFLAVAGLFFLKKQQSRVFPTVALFCLLFLYITSAWNIWWYGGSLGMRALVQSYALWIFPLASSVNWLTTRGKRGKTALFLIALPCCWINLWWTYQAHRPKGLFVTEQMNKSLYWRGLDPRTSAQDVNRLLDNAEVYQGGGPQNRTLLLQTGFENDTTAVTTERPITGRQSLRLSKDVQFSPEINLTLPSEHHSSRYWLRTTVTFRAEPKEWEWWLMTQMIVRFSAGVQKVKDNMLRLQRFADSGVVQSVYLDTRVPDQPFDKVTVFFWNGEGQKAVWLDDLTVERFE